MTKKNLRFGLIGHGLWGRHHAQAIVEVPGAELVAVAEQSGDGRAAAEAAFPNVDVLSDYQQLIQRDDIDPRGRLQSMLATAYSRKIQADELDRWESSLIRLSDLRQTNQNDIMTNKQLWADIAHAIFNTKEFIYLR